MTSTPQNALAVTTAFAPRGGYRSSFAALTRIESVRLARHPALLVGVALGIGFTIPTLIAQTSAMTADALSSPIVALTVGLGGMLATFHLTRSFERADELLEASPTSRATRTGALCLTAIVPVLIASLWLAFYYGVSPAALHVPQWMYGMFSHADVAAVLVGNSVVAALGGALLGVAAGRWWGFRAASAVLVAGVLVWTFAVLVIFSPGDGVRPEWNRWVRLFAPAGFFSSTSADNASVISHTGSPWWYLVWLLTLCALAAVAALLWRSESATRRRVVRLGAITLAVSVVTYGLAAGGGLSHQVRTFSNGHSVVMTK